MAVADSEVGRAISRLDAWFETMRGEGGYGGPISHWWESSVLYCGPMVDWRYEGIIGGYLALFRSTGKNVWLDRAKRAGDDVLTSRLPNGNYRNSAFQQGPMEAGTPHEAAVDTALLELAYTLREQSEDRWHAYFQAAERNIETFLLGKLWTEQGFRDQAWNMTLVPNKNAAVIEALVLYERISGRDMSRYIDVAADVILDAQERGGKRAGATVHTGTGRHRLAIGLYTARSMSGLIRLHHRRPNDYLLERVAAAIGFLRALSSEHGTYFGRYRDGKLLANPQLIAGTGDILRLMISARDVGLASDIDAIRLARSLIDAQQPTGGLPTGYGFARRGGTRPYHGIAEFRDVLPVVGWADKAFRALSLLAPSNVIVSDIDTKSKFSTECLWKGRRCTWQEDTDRMELRDSRTGRALYRWRKGTSHPDIYAL